MAENLNSDTHPVMTYLPLPYFSKLQAIAAYEKRRPGPQASQFIENSVDAYLAKHPDIAQACNGLNNNNDK